MKLASQSRRRATAAQMEQRHDAIVAIVNMLGKCTLRQVYYQCTVRHIIDKTEQGYHKIGRALTELRRRGRVPYSAVIDPSRRKITAGSWDSVADLLEAAESQYRRDFWQDKEETVQVWVEKEALAEIAADVTRRLHVPLYICKGYPSHSFVHAAVQEIEEDGRTCHVYHFGDFDPSGVNASETVENLLGEFNGTVPIHFERVALTEEQVERWSLPTRPTKQSDTRAKTWGDKPSVELDTLTTQQLRGLVEEVIVRHIEQKDIDKQQELEKRERHYLRQVCAGWNEAVAKGGAISLLPPA